MSDIRLSIIIPFFNVEKFIGRCLESVYSQDIPENEYEVICVDDSSPDDSLSIVQAYAQKHANLRIVKNKQNRKLGGARNAGLDVASGDYIWFIDSDDFIEDNVLGVLCSTAETDELDVLHFNYENYPERTPLHQLQETVTMTGAEIIFDRRFIWYHDLVTAWRKLYRRSFLTDNHIVFAEHIMFEDSDYALMVFAKADRVRHINLFAYNYRVNPDSITRVKYDSSHIYFWLNLCERMLKLKVRLEEEGADNRFQSLIDSFVRNETLMVLWKYHTFPAQEKRVARRMINEIIDSKLKPYISRSNYYKFKLRII